MLVFSTFFFASYLCIFDQVQRNKKSHSAECKTKTNFKAVFSYFYINIVY